MLDMFIGAVVANRLNGPDMSCRLPSRSTFSSRVRRLSLDPHEAPQCALQGLASNTHLTHTST